jgi:hypothetical protein
MVEQVAVVLDVVTQMVLVALAASFFTTNS